VQIDSNFEHVNLPTTFIGGISAASDDGLGIFDISAKTFLARKGGSKNLYQTEATSSGCTGWTPKYSVQHALAYSNSGPITLIAAPNAIKHRCYISGVSGDWQSVNSSGIAQPFADVKVVGSAITLEVGPNVPGKVIRAEATCIQIKQ
jgi:hypothetical protein